MATRRSTTTAPPAGPQRAPLRRSSASRAVHVIVLVLAALIALFFLGRLANVTYRQLLCPYDLLYESPALSTMHVIRAGMNPYAPSTYAQPPFVITLYTPLYHYLVAALPQWPGNPWLVGRLVTLIATALAAALLVVIGYRRVPWLVSLALLAIYLAFWPVSPNAVFLKNDSLALLLGGAAVVLLYRGAGRRWAMILAGVLCVMAVAAKQSYIASTLACLVYLLLSNRRMLGWFAISATVAGLAFLLIITLVWGNGFWFSTIGALRHPISFSWGSDQFIRLFQQPLSWAALSLPLVLLWRMARSQPASRLIESPFLIYLGCALLIVLLTIWNTGSGSNYFMEPLLAAFMWIVYALGSLDFPNATDRTTWAALIVLVACCAAEPLVAQQTDYTFADDQKANVARALNPLLRQDVRALGYTDPLILNLTSHVFTYVLGGRPVLSDPYGYLLMWSGGTLDLNPMLQSITDHTYDIIVLPSTWLDAPVLPPVEYRITAAILHAYRPARKTVGLVYFVRP